MAGEAKTSAFMLGTATVMLGATDSIFDLNPEDHSIGLVKNFRVTSQPSFTELTQGVKNQTVYSLMTGNVIRATMEAYEYTAKNIAYSLGLEGSGFTEQTVEAAITTPASATDTSISVDDETGFVVDDYFMIQEGAEDQVYVRKVASTATGSILFTQPLPKPIAAGARVMKANAIPVGSKEDQPFLAAKIVGTLADNTEVVLLCPKIRVTNGFSLGFTTEGFDNLPYEFSFYDQVATDPFFSEFKGEQAKLLTTK